MIKQRIVFISICIFLFSCGTKQDRQKDLLGKWEASEYFSFDKLKKIPAFADEIPDNAEMEMSIEATTIYMRGSRYNSDMKMTLYYTMAGNKFDIKLNIRESGTWTLEDNFLILVLEDSRVSPLNEFAKKAAKQDPDFLTNFSSVKGEATSVEILELTDKTLTYKSEEFPDYIWTEQKRY